MKIIKFICVSFFLILLIFSLTGCYSTKEKTPTFGELIELNDSCISYKENMQCEDMVLIFKVKIDMSYNNKSTIDQNYYNVFDYINNNSDKIKKYSKIDYVAITTTETGDEYKIISFEVDKDVINGVINNNIKTAQELGEVIDNQFISPNLKN